MKTLCKLGFIYSPAYLSARLSACRSVYLPACLSACLCRFVYLLVGLSVRLSAFLPCPFCVVREQKELSENGEAEKVTKINRLEKIFIEHANSGQSASQMFTWYLVHVICTHVCWQS